jgi:hypothetical protein
MLRDDSDMRHQISAMMLTGLETNTRPFPQTNREFGQLLAEVRELATDDLRAKLVLVGFVSKPHGPDLMRCQECMYYLVHRKWCDLPELALPVEPDWCCRLWRI